MSGAVHALAHERRAERAGRTERRARDDARVARLVAARPKIVIQTGEIEAAVDQAEAALMASDRGLFQRANMIVHVGHQKNRSFDGTDMVASKIFERGDHALLEDLSAAAAFVKADRRTDGLQVCNPPMAVVRTLKERGGRLRLPILRAVISAPTLRADGSVLQYPGYDAATGLLFEPGATDFPKVPDRPTREDASTALRLLIKLIETFPFVEDADKAVALSAIITACVRTSIPTSPMHAFTAPVAGSGKSKLVDLVSVLLTGREAAVLSQGRTEEEAEKRLGSLLLTGDTMIAIDNCEQPVGGEFLCSMLTQQSVKVRILGKSEAPELPAHAFVTATGNNLILLGDMTRRALLCSLDPHDERPEHRKFSNDPVADARSGRPELVVAALTIARAYSIAGRPDLRDPFGIF